MKFTVIGRKITVTDKVKDYVEKKLSKLDKFFKDDTEARVVLGTIKDQEYIEVNLYASGMVYRSEVYDQDIMAAIDRTVDVIERQIRKNKTRLAKRLRPVEPPVWSAPMISGDQYTDGEETDEFEIVKRKRFQMKPMSPEEAVLQMNLLGHSFFVFKNMDTDEMNVVYKRRDGKYAIIESID